MYIGMYIYIYILYITFWLKPFWLKPFWLKPATYCMIAPHLPSNDAFVLPSWCAGAAALTPGDDARGPSAADADADEHDDQLADDDADLAREVDWYAFVANKEARYFSLRCAQLIA